MPAPMPTVGQMRHRVEVQAPTRGTANAHGERPITFATVATVYADVQEVSGSELTQSQTQREEVGYRVAIRYYPGLDATYQLLWGTRTLNIQSVTNPDGRRRFHELTCSGYGGGP